MFDLLLAAACILTGAAVLSAVASAIDASLDHIDRRYLR